MNSAYSSLINSIPGQISLSGNFQDQINNPIFNYSNPNTDSSPILNLYNPAYAAVAQSRLLSSLNHNGSPNLNNLASNDASAASSITSTDHNQNLPPSFNHGQHSDAASPGITNMPFYSSPHPPFPGNNNNSNQLCCDFGSAWRSAAHMMAGDHNPYVNYENAAWSSPYGYIGNATLDLNSARRKNATRESTSTLKAWLQEHIKNPYPTKGEKIMLAIITKMTLTQVSTWFANARRRLKKENKMTWSPKNRSDDATNSDLETETKGGKDNESEDGLKSETRLDPLSDSEDINTKNGFDLPSKLSEVKPKIWSLAHTATSGLFPMGLQSYPGTQCMDHNSPDHTTPGGHPYPPMNHLIQNHPFYQHPFGPGIDVIPNQLTCSDMKQYPGLYPDNNNTFFSQSHKRSELL